MRSKNSSTALCYKDLALKIRRLDYDTAVELEADILLMLEKRKIWPKNVRAQGEKVFIDPPRGKPYRHLLWPLLDKYKFAGFMTTSTKIIDDLYATRALQIFGELGT